MVNLGVVRHAAQTYAQNIRSILLFSIASFLAFLIPAFAAFPTYTDAGGIFIRTSGIFINLSVYSTAVIVVSVFFSLLFLSFAIVAINVVVKHSRTQTRIRDEVIRGLERYTGRVFLLLLAYTLVLFAVNIVTFHFAFSWGLFTALAGLVAAPFVFYAPASIVIDGNRIARAISASRDFFEKAPGNFLLWITAAVLLVSASDLVFIAVAGTLFSRYLMLVFNSFVILPFLVVLQSQMYVSRFKALGS